MSFELRPYQADAVDSIYKYFMSNSGNPLIVMPTGTGKSIVIDEFISRALRDYPETRILCLVHVRELIDQNHKALIKMWPDAPAGIYSAGLGKRDKHAQILFAGIQSVYKKINQFDPFDLVLIDEAHLIPRNSDTMYGAAIKALRDSNPNIKVVGFTATPFRKDSGMLHQGDEALFSDICYECDIGYMIAQGYLTEVVPKVTSVQLDVTGVEKQGGDFVLSQLEAAVNRLDITEQAVQEIVTKGKDRGSWLCFCSGVKHALAVAEAIRGHGIDCETVTGETPTKERDRILDDFKTGKLRAITNANVLTTGFDAPGVDLIAMLRPTASTGLHVQMIGRGTRLAEGKEDCLVLDFAGNTGRHGPLDRLNIKKPGKGGDGDAPVKECPQCWTYVHASIRICPHCDYIFPPPEVKISRRSQEDALLTSQIEERFVDVSRCEYRPHTSKKSGSRTMRVDYWCGNMKHSEYVCFDHEGFPRTKAEQWFKKRLPGHPVPASVDEALDCSYPTPKQIAVIPEGKYTRISKVKF